jgi:diacylglycerol kinase (ATP)
MKVLFLINPRAGEYRGTVRFSALQRLLNCQRQGLQTTVECTRADAIRGQLMEMAPGNDRIVVVGGDGTVSEAMNAMCQLGLSIPVGIIPFGSGNDLARSLGLYRRGLRDSWCLEDMLAYATTDRTTPVDVWSLNGRLTFNNYMSVGLDSWVVRGFARTRNWIIRRLNFFTKPVSFATYILSWLWNAGRRVQAGTRMTWVDADGKQHFMDLREPRVLAISNTPYYAAGAPIDRDASVGDALFEVTVFPNMYQYAKLLAMRVPLLAGLGAGHRWFRIRARGLLIHLPEPTCVQVDGEDVTDHFREDRQLSVKHHGQIQVLV